MGLYLKAILNPHGNEGAELAQDSEHQPADPCGEFLQSAERARFGLPEPLTKAELEALREGLPAIIDRCVAKMKLFLEDERVKDALRRDLPIAKALED
jgi:hypothetical protein